MSNDPNTDYRQGFADGWAAGWMAASRQGVAVVTSAIQMPATCSKCGMRLDFMNNYVCHDAQCPQTPRVTCTTGGVA